MSVFECSSRFSSPVAKLWAFHERPDAIRLLSPPFPPVQIVRDTGGLGVGSEKEFLVFFGAIRWLARHVECVRGQSFTDIQVSGPFRSWRHQHLMEPDGEGSRLTDHVEFELAGGRLAAAAVTLMLRGLFWWRHRATRRWVEQG